MFVVYEMIVCYDDVIVIFKSTEVVVVVTNDVWTAAIVLSHNLVFQVIAYTFVHIVIQIIVYVVVKTFFGDVFVNHRRKFACEVISDK